MRGVLNYVPGNTILHRLKGQLAAIGLLDHSEQTVTIMEAFRAGNTAV